MKFNNVEYRDWRKIYNAIKNGKSKEEVYKIYNEFLPCILCEMLRFRKKYHSKTSS
jgi:predicted choloylglycine hydrolase